VEPAQASIGLLTDLQSRESRNGTCSVDRFGAMTVGIRTKLTRLLRPTAARSSVWAGLRRRKRGRAIQVAGDQLETLTRRFLEHLLGHADGAEGLVEIAWLLDAERFAQARSAASFAKGDLAAAAEMLRNVVSTYPTVFNAVGLTHCYGALGRDADAIALLEDFLHRFPEDTVLWLELGGARFRGGDTRSANQCLDRVKHAFAQDQRDVQPLVRELDRALRDRLVERPAEADIYDDQFVTALWHTNRKEYETGSWYLNNTAFVFRAMNTRLRNVLTDGRLRHVVDFGVMCGRPIYDLACEHPTVQFDAWDRQHLIKSLNESAYSAPNLAFFDGEPLDFLRARVRRGETLLYHARTGTLLYPAFLSRFYEACCRVGVSDIVLFEPCSLSRDLLRFQDYEDMAELSIARRGPMLLHNYPRLLKEAGYDVLKIERLAYGHLLQPAAQAVDQFVYIHARRP